MFYSAAFDIKDRPPLITDYERFIFLLACLTGFLAIGLFFIVLCCSMDFLEKRKTRTTG